MRVKVIVPKDNFKFDLPVPLGLFINRLTCPMIAHYANKYTKGYHLNSEQLYRLFKCLKDSKKTYGHYDLVDIESSDGEIIKISL